jgi:uncharacterized protein YdhG (YjbR/CyaY superfamily)
VRAKARTVDEYLARLPPEQRAALERLRKTIRSAAPKAEESVSYGICAFRQNGMLVGFGATRGHCAFYVMSATMLHGYEDEITGYDTGKGTIRFQPRKPLPAALVRKLVKARLAENTARSSGTSRRGSRPT